MKTSELAGAALDWAVAKCEGRIYGVPGTKFEFQPSYKYSQGGPIIEREKISIVYDDTAWRADPDMMGSVNQRQWG